MTSPRYADVAVGDELPTLEIPITAKLIVGGAVASRDFQDVHHDLERARELGSPNIFMNILSTNGLIGRFVTDWAGPEARLKKVDIRLGAPNYPGDTMTFSGAVSAKDDDLRLISIEVRGRNQYGDHVTGVVSLNLPE